MLHRGNMMFLNHNFQKLVQTCEAGTFAAGNVPDVHRIFTNPFTRRGRRLPGERRRLSLPCPTHYL
nr:hypothetical protein REQ54_01952 [Rhizobium sp. Q54]